LDASVKSLFRRLQEILVKRAPHLPHIFSVAENECEVIQIDLAEIAGMLLNLLSNKQIDCGVDASMRLLRQADGSSPGNCTTADLDIFYVTARAGDKGLQRM
jgi:hypothetical protein